MHNFDFAKPSTIADAAKALAADGAQALSGGQTLIPTMKQRLAAPGVLVSLTGIKEMQGVCTGDGGLHIGAATPHAVVAKEAKAHYPALAALAGGIGDHRRVDCQQRPGGLLPLGRARLGCDGGDEQTQDRCG
jgi:aerobic carbon-monoxide dehydrogenase medium subunit